MATRWINKDRLFAKLRKSIPAVKEEMEKFALDSAEEVARTARSYAPVSTGALRNSIRVTPAGGTPPAFSQGASVSTVPEGAALVSAGNSRVRYAHVVEFGSRPHEIGGKFAGAQHPGTPPRPFFFPSYRMMRSRIRSRGTRALNRALKKSGLGRR